MESSDIDPECRREFEAAERRSLKERLDFGFVQTYKPVRDDELFRSFRTMDEYRRWCRENLPAWLGYGE